MDDFINSFISSPTWADTTALPRSSWRGTVLSERNGLLYGSLEPCGDEETLSTCMLPSNTTLGGAAGEDSNLHGKDGASSVFADGSQEYKDDKSLYSNPRLSQHKLCNEAIDANLISSENHSRSYSMQGAIGNNSTAGFEPAFSHSNLAISSSTESNSSELSAFPRALGDAPSITSVPTLWPSSLSSLSSYIGHGNLPAFGFQEVENNLELLRKPYPENGNFGQLSLPASLHTKDMNDLYKTQFSSFSVEQQTSIPPDSLLSQKEQNGLQFPAFYSGPQFGVSNTAGVMGCQQLSQASERHTTSNQTKSSSATQPQAAQVNSSNGAVKPRARARRGQATDPHSIAERLRREKIAERMKNLQELVPNSNKADKASMLDEIIDYVKFLQLQVKVLSMSRLGATGAVIPLLTDVQRPHIEGCGGLLLTSSDAHGGKDIFDTEDDLAFEQEVVKLMETNVTSAMQYLQNKGLCLMPIALASAISKQKGSSTATPSSYNHTEISHTGNGVNNCKGTAIKQEETLKKLDNGRDSIAKFK